MLVSIFIFRANLNEGTTKLQSYIYICSTIYKTKAAMGFLLNLNNYIQKSCYVSLNIIFLITSL